MGVVYEARGMASAILRHEEEIKGHEKQRGLYEQLKEKLQKIYDRMKRR
jgi:hypothetical protein